jgi:branched-subunit amino acid ABC-type transport system permease component
VLETILQGVLLGGLYTLFALGQSLMFGVMRLTNTAQGDFIILGAFAVITCLPAHAADGDLPAIPAMTKFLAGRTPRRERIRLDLPPLATTFRRSIASNLLLEVFSADPRSIETGGLNTQGLRIGESLSLGVLPSSLAVALVATGRCNGCSRTRRSAAPSAPCRTTANRRVDGAEREEVYALATAIAFVLIAVAGAAGHAHDGVAVGRAAAAALRLRGRDHRRHGLLLGHAGRRDDPGHHAADRLPARSRVGDLDGSPGVPSGPRVAPARTVPQDSRMTR